jgi:hypothetical protein
MFALAFHRPHVIESPHAGPSELVAAPLLALYLLLGRRLPRVAWLRLAVLVVTLLPSVVAAPSQGRALAQLAGLVYVALLSGAAMTLGDERPRALAALCAGAALACGLGLAGAALDLAGVANALAQRYPWMPLPRPIGPDESPAMLSMVALAGATSLMALARARQLSRRLVILGLVLFTATLIAAQSRVLLAALIGVAVALRRRRPWAAGALALSALAPFVLSLTIRIVPLTARPPFVDTHPTPYRVCHSIGLRMFAAHPLTGVGLHAFQSEWPRFYDPARDDAAYAGAEWLRGLPRDPHGTLTGYLAEDGIAAFALLAFFAVDVWRRRRREPEVEGFLAAVAVASFTLDLFTERGTWALIGLFTAVGESDPKATRS